MTGVKVPKGQTLWETHYDKKGAVSFIVTSNENRSTYSRYDLYDGKPVKTKTGNTPTALRE